MSAPISNRAGRPVTPGDLRQLGRRTVDVRIHLRTFDVSAAVIRLRPEERFHYLRRRSVRWVHNVRIAATPVRWRISDLGGHDIPVEIAARMPADLVAGVARLAPVSRIEVRSRLTLQPGPRHTAVAPWYCVRERVVVQVESQRRGLQTVEDRFVMVRAQSEAVARQKALSEARAYARPYINSDGLLVRWQLEAIVSIECVDHVDLQPEGSEVFSSLRTRRMGTTPGWHPRSSKRAG